MPGWAACLTVLCKYTSAECERETKYAMKIMIACSLIKTLQILVATPGRLLDHIENKSGLSVRLMGLKMLVLDEADHLLDLGFRKDVENIVDCLPRRRQSLLFSATMPKEVSCPFPNICTFPCLYK